jgi:protein-S-isoprenylcysteine O-methyltransferase Ste14
MWAGGTLGTASWVRYLASKVMEAPCRKGGMAKRADVVGSEIKRDLLFFGLPAFVVFTFGLIACAVEGSSEAFVVPFSTAQIGAMALFGVGLTTMLVAQATLKRSYSGTLVVRHDHRLVTHGIYRLARHPIYLGGIIAVCLGIPLFALSPLGFVIMLILIPIILNRIRMEEALLVAHYGDTYRAYQKRTRKLVPFVY